MKLIDLCKIPVMIVRELAEKINEYCDKNRWGYKNSIGELDEPNLTKKIYRI